jgi:phosphoenolpyruvate carboxykinase (ATP)
VKPNGITRGSDLEALGIANVNSVYWNAPTPVLYEQIIQRREAVLAGLGAVVVKTGRHSGRSPLDKFIVDEPDSHDKIWWGAVNRPIPPSNFEIIHERLLKSLHGKDLFVQDCFVGARKRHRLPIRVITEKAWHSLFARNMFIRPTSDELESHQPEFTILAVPGSHSVPSTDGTNSEIFIVISFSRRLVLIGGTGYAGEIKKSVFTIMNYLLPRKSVFPMHCSANVGSTGDTAIFFGLSGTGKTTLSADSKRLLVGDDEHGWDDEGIFNFEGGCYAKVIRLSREIEPEIFKCAGKFGTILENVYYDPLTRRIDLDNDFFTENTRASYPLSHMPGTVHSGTAGHPGHVIMLTCDAFGVLPPIARLTTDQAIYHFLSGYTAKVAGTESGIGKEPVTTFSACFGAPFMPLHPGVYAKMLKDKITKHKSVCWLINTGWTGGAFGTGKRISVRHSRAMVNAAISGALDGIEFITEPFFDLSIPGRCPDVPPEILNPRLMWRDGSAYANAAKALRENFRNNFAQLSEHETVDSTYAL